MGCGAIKAADFPDDTESKRDEVIATLARLEKQLDEAFNDVKMNCDLSMEIVHYAKTEEFLLEEMSTEDLSGKLSAAINLVKRVEGLLKESIKIGY